MCWRYASGSATRGHEAHLVGGGVRDMLLGREPADFDIATDARPEAVLDLFGHAYAIPTGIKHGTVTVLTNGIFAPRGGDHLSW